MAKKQSPRPKKLTRIYLREWMAHRGVTQVELAHQLDMSQANVSRYVRDPYGMPFGKTLLIAEILRIPPALLYHQPPADDLAAITAGADPETLKVIARAARGIMGGDG